MTATRAALDTLRVPSVGLNTFSFPASIRLYMVLRERWAKAAASVMVRYSALAMREAARALRSAVSIGFLTVDGLLSG